MAAVRGDVLHGIVDQSSLLLGKLVLEGYVLQHLIPL